MTHEQPAQDADQAVHMDLPDDLTAPRAARAETRDAMKAWRLHELLDPVVLTVSELVGNAVRHGKPPVAMLLRRTRRSVRIEVHDEGVETPPDDPEAVGTDAESGRGLLIVNALSDDTGVEQIPGDGKVTWASFDSGSSKPS